MKTTFKIVLLAIIFIPFSVFSQDIDEKLAKKIAKEVYTKNKKDKSSADFKDVIVLGNNKKKDTLIYVVNFKKSGYVLVSGNKSAPPVLGYSLDGVFDLSDMPPGLTYLLKKYKSSISNLKLKKEKPTKEIEAQWDVYESTSTLIETQSLIINPFVPLIETSWYQSGNYNNLIPNDDVAGCVAIAMSQILNYWECRIEPTGSKTYNGNTANFGSTTYDWSQMIDSYGESNNQLLIYHAGISCETDYGTTSSSSTEYKARDGFVNHWGISSSASVRERTWYNEYTWRTMIINELEEGRPILYSGCEGIFDCGHSWIIDAYNLYNQFHCVFGWSTNNTGWFLLGDFDSANGSYNYFETFIQNVYPIEDEEVGTPVLSNNIFDYNPNGYTLSISPVRNATSYEWITENGTISGSGTSVTLNSTVSTEVKVRAFTDWCDTYSSYSIADITISYGPIEGPITICTSNETYTIDNCPTNAMIEWSNSSNLLRQSDVDGEEYIVKAIGVGSGWVEANVNGITFRKNVNVGVDGSFTGPYSINYLDYGTWSANASCGTEPYYYQWYLDNVGDNDAPAQIATGQVITLKSVAAGTSQQLLITTETIESPTIMGPSNYTTFNLSLKISDDNGYYRWADERTITAYGDVDLIQSYDPGNPTPFSMTAYSTTEQTGYVTIYPNPANEELTIRSLSDSSIDLILYDEQSNIIFKGKLNNKDIVWNTSNLDEGIYYLHIYKGDELTKRQILIEHK